MNILFVNSISKHKFGGGEKWMVTAASGLCRAGHTVFMASKKGAELLAAAENSGIRTVIFNVRSDFSPLNTLRIRRFLKREAIDVLICNLNKDVRVAGLAARLAGTSAVIARHGVLLCAKKWKHKVTLQRLVDGILTNTKSIKERYDNYGWFDEQFVEVIYNGVEIRDDTQPFDFCRQFPGKKIIFAAGRLSPQKGFTYLIESLSLLRKQRDDLQLVIAGRGAQESALRALAVQLEVEDSVHFAGYATDIRPYLKGCDLFVLSSIFEGMPNVVMEAMAVSKAVVATGVNGVNELMRHGETGLIVPPKDPVALSEAIASIIDDRKKLSEFGARGLRRVMTDFTVDAMVDNLEKYFLDKIKKRSNA